MEPRLKAFLSNLNISTMTTLIEGSLFKVVYDPDGDTMASYMGECANYYLINKSTNMIEGGTISEYAARTMFDTAEGLVGKAKEVREDNVKH